MLLFILLCHFFCKDDFTAGGFKIIRMTWANQTISRSSKQTTMLRVGTFIIITKVVEENERIRGQLENGNWISLKSTVDDRVWVEPMQKVSEIYKQRAFH